MRQIDDKNNENWANSLNNFLAALHDTNVQKIIKTINGREMQSTKILHESHVPVSKFYNIMNLLVSLRILYRDTLSDRTVVYSLSSLSKVIDTVSLIDKIQKNQIPSNLSEIAQEVQKTKKLNPDITEKKKTEVVNERFPQ